MDVARWKRIFRPTGRVRVVDERIADLDLVTVAEAARIMGLHRNAVRKRAERAQLEGARLNGGTGDWVFRRSVIVAAME